MTVLTPTILFEDTHLVVVDKPSGLLSQGEHKGDPNLVDWLRQYLGRNYVGLVHRLDRNTSGVMVVAKRSKSADRLSESLREGRLERTYLAWVQGDLKNPATWHHFLEKNEKTNRVTVFKTAPPSSKEAILQTEPLEHAHWENKAITLAQFKLETGRSHQIRAQASAEGYPLLGDPKYGGPEFTRLALHSWRLRFDHPMSGEWLLFEAPLPEELRPESIRKIHPFK